MTLQIAALQGFGPTLEQYSCLFLPETVKLLRAAEPGSRAQIETLIALQRLSCWVSLLRVMNTLTPLLLHILREQQQSMEELPELEHSILQLLVTLACQSGRTWRVRHIPNPPTQRDDIYLIADIYVVNSLPRCIY